jgi:hypothetical protein
MKLREIGGIRVHYHEHSVILLKMHESEMSPIGRIGRVGLATGKR